MLPKQIIYVESDCVGIVVKLCYFIDVIKKTVFQCCPINSLLKPPIKVARQLINKEHSAENVHYVGVNKHHNCQPLEKGFKTSEACCFVSDGTRSLHY